MKKKIRLLGFFGFPVGIAIGFILSIVISLLVGTGDYYPVPSQLAETMGSELKAVILQTVLCGIMGSGFAMSSVVWDMDSWSLAKQSGIYFLLSAIVMFPIAYITHWMNHSVSGILSYIGIFVAIFLIIWITRYLIWKRKIRRMNAHLRKQ